MDAVHRAMPVLTEGSGEFRVECECIIVTMQLHSGGVLSYWLMFLFMLQTRLSTVQRERDDYADEVNECS